MLEQDRAQEVTQALVDEFVGACHGDAARVEELLGTYPSLVSGNAKWGETPIEAAAQMNRRDIADMLLAQGAPLDICTAAVFGMAGKVREHLDADPNAHAATGAHGIPLMYFPVIGGHKDIAQMLLERGADLNAGAGGNTALHGAAMFGRADMAKWLLDNGANPAAANYEGKTALEVAIANKHAEVADILMGH